MQRKRFIWTIQSFKQYLLDLERGFFCLCTERKLLERAYVKKLVNLAETKKENKHI
jgi:hypothetical protein